MFATYDWFTFHAHNQPTLHGCGTLAEAGLYQDLLNSKREIDCYAFRRSTGEEIARIDFTDEGFCLSDEILYLQVSSVA